MKCAQKWFKEVYSSPDMPKEWLEGKNSNLTSGISASLFGSSASITETNIYLKYIGRLQAFFNFKIKIPLATKKYLCELSLKIT